MSYVFHFSCVGNTEHSLIIRNLQYTFFGKGKTMDIKCENYQKDTIEEGIHVLYTFFFLEIPRHIASEIHNL